MRRGAGGEAMSTVKLYTPNKTNRQALAEWEELYQSIFRTTTPRSFKSSEEKSAYKKHIEKPGNQELWFAEMFPAYYKSKAAKFQINSTKRLLSKTRYRQSRRWARGLSKSTRRMMEILYKHFVEGYRLNLLLISKTEDNAARLLDPYRANLEANQRLIDFYGLQEKPGKWGAYEFVTRKGASFRAVGVEQNPRGARLEELRVTCIIFDDADDDEVCRNIDRLNVRWEWVEKAVLPTVDISGAYLIFFDNNPIAEDCLVNRFAAYTDDDEVVPIINNNGESTWPEKNSLADIQAIRSGMSDYAFQGEYLCNPVRLGKVFEKINWGKCPSLHRLAFAIIYSDPATSNRDKPSQKSTAPNSTKPTVVVGYFEGKFYIYNCRVDHMNNDTFIRNIYDMNDWALLPSPSGDGQGLPAVAGVRAMAVYNFIENNSLQDPFFEQVLKPAIHRVAKEMGRSVISISGDDRKKPDKFFRIEATLQPLNKNGQLIFNEKEKSNPHMQRLESQFLSVSPNSKTMDGPDAVEGAVWIIQNKLSLAGGNLNQVIRQVPRPINNKRL